MPGDRNKMACWPGIGVEKICLALQRARWSVRRFPMADSATFWVEDIDFKERLASQTDGDIEEDD